jgi:hypothetical protein
MFRCAFFSAALVPLELFGAYVACAKIELLEHPSWTPKYVRLRAWRLWLCLVGVRYTLLYMPDLIVCWPHVPMFTFVACSVCWLHVGHHSCLLLRRE